jgi:hypothetical protein
MIDKKVKISRAKRYNRLSVKTKVITFFTILRLFFVPDLSSGVFVYLRGMKAALREIFLITYAKVIGYYKHIDYLPIYNWDKLSNGEFNYLYKFRIKATPRFFKRWYVELFYQFEKIEMSGFEDMLKLAYLKSLYVTTKQAKYLNMARSLEKRIKSKPKTKPQKLNDMVNFVEETFSSIGSINVHKMSTSRFYSLYYRAIKKIKDSNIKK